MSPTDRLLTPILHKTDRNVPWPEGTSTAMLLARNGLWMCRRHAFFTSSVPARHWPAELHAHEASFELHHPKIPTGMFERIVGFFGFFADRHTAEAAVLLTWSKRDQSIDLVVPDQLATVGRTRGGECYPIGVHYQVPNDVGAHRTVIGDVHSHVFDAAYCSSRDQEDEVYRPGLHLVVGRLDRELPELHAEYVVDGMRFPVDPRHVVEGFERRDEVVPTHWIERVQVRVCEDKR